MPKLRSATALEGRINSAARALLRATGVKGSDIGKPIVAIANSYTQFVPGHVHLKNLGDLVAEQVYAAGAIAREFHTIAVDDGIAMGHLGMLYSLPSRDLIADSVEYMVNAHCADALVCISNCDKITPGMLMAALRLNIPTVFVSGGPMEAGKVQWEGKTIKIDAADSLVVGGSPASSDEKILAFEEQSCPTCGSCAGMFTANSMNCLVEALGLALPGNGTVVATHADRKGLFERAGTRVVELAKRWYEHDDASVLPRSIAGFEAFENAMRMDVAMGGSTNTVLHLLAAAHEADAGFTIADIDRISRSTPAPREALAVDAAVAHRGLPPRGRRARHPRRARPARADPPRRSYGAQRDARRGAGGLGRAPKPFARSAGALSRGARRRALEQRVLAVAPLGHAGCGPRAGLHPRRGQRLQRRRRAGGAARQPRRAGLHREDRGRRRIGAEVSRQRDRLRERGRRAAGDPGRPRAGRGTWS